MVIKAMDFYLEHHAGKYINWYLDEPILVVGDQLVLSLILLMIGFLLLASGLAIVMERDFQ